MTDDSPIVQEVRRRREQISEQFGDDIHRYAEHLRELEKQYAERVVDQPTVVRSRAPSPQGKKAG